jgi:hypothetical protein
MKLKINNFLQKNQGKKIESKIIWTKLKNMIFINLDRMMKLKTNNTFTKELRPKNRNKKNKD